MALYDENLLKREQTKIVNCYTKIGECYYVAHKDDVNPEFHELIDAVKASEKVMADHKAEVLRSRDLLPRRLWLKSLLPRSLLLRSLLLRNPLPRNPFLSTLRPRFSTPERKRQSSQKRRFAQSAALFSRMSARSVPSAALP